MAKCHKPAAHSFIRSYFTRSALPIKVPVLSIKRTIVLDLHCWLPASEFITSLSDFEIFVHLTWPKARAKYLQIQFPPFKMYSNGLSIVQLMTVYHKHFTLTRCWSIPRELRGHQQQQWTIMPSAVIFKAHCSNLYRRHHHAHSKASIHWFISSSTRTTTEIEYNRISNVITDQEVGNAAFELCIYSYVVSHFQSRAFRYAFRKKWDY